MSQMDRGTSIQLNQIQRHVKNDEEKRLYYEIRWDIGGLLRRLNSGIRLIDATQPRRP